MSDVTPAVAKPSFGTALRQRRVRQQVSLAALAELVNYSKGYLSKVETGARRATVELAARCDTALQADGELAALVTDCPRSRHGMVPPPTQLPSPIWGFAGRGTALSQLDAACGKNAIVMIVGAPGVGKTALALHWAHRVIERFPDGCLFADLRGYGPLSLAAEPSEVLDGFLRALSVPPEAMPSGLESRSALLRTALFDKQMLIILDNVATPDQVRPLLPGSPGCKVLITGRTSLSGLAARDGASRLELESLSEDEAVALLRHAFDPERPDADPAALAEIARWCGYLPLALRIAADRALGRPRLELADLAGQLAAERGRLDVLATDDDESTAVRSVFSWSYRRLPFQAKRMFRFLALHPGPHISVPAAGALAATSLPQAGRLLETLALAHLLEETAPDRYRCHDLLRLYAAERVMAEESDEDRASAKLRLLTWYLHTADAADRLLMPHRRHLELSPAGPYCAPVGFACYDQALEWCDDEYPNLIAATKLAERMGEDAIAWGIPAALWSFFSLRKPWDGWVRSCETGYASAQRSGDRLGQAQMLTSLGAAHADLRNFGQSTQCFHRALAIRRESGDQQGEGSVLINVGNVHVMQGRFGDGVASFDQALRIFRSIGDRFREGIALNDLGEAYRALGRLAEATNCFRRALSIMREIGDSFNEGDVVHNLADVHHDLGEHANARVQYLRALAIRREIGDRPGEAITLRRLGDLCSELDRPREAREAWRGALAIYQDLGDPQAAGLRDRVTTGEARTGSGAGQPRTRPSTGVWPS